METNQISFQLRLLKGQECTPQEVLCKIEYKTQNGTACVFTAAQKVEQIEKLEFLEAEDGKWCCIMYTDHDSETAMLSQQQAYAIFLQGEIDIEALKADSLQIQHKIMQEKAVEKKAQGQKAEDTIW